MVFQDLMDPLALKVLEEMTVDLEGLDIQVITLYNVVKLKLNMHCEIFNY